MVDPPPTPPGHWVQCPECLRFFENEQGRGSHRLHNHGIRSTGDSWVPARPSPPPPPQPMPAPPLAEPTATVPAPTPEPAPEPVSEHVDLSDGKNASAGLSVIA